MAASRVLNWLSAWEPVPFPMPVKIGALRPILRIAGQKNPLPLEIRKALSRDTVFDELFSVHDNPVIIVHRPKATIKLPVGVLR